MLRFTPLPDDHLENKRMILCCRRCEYWQELPTFLDQYKNQGTCHIDIESKSLSRPTTKDKHICSRFESKFKLVFDQNQIARGKATG